MKKVILTLSSIACSIVAYAQDEQSVEMADLMRENGKIYVVTGVITIVFFVVIAYLVSIDRKLTRLERKIKK